MAAKRGDHIMQKNITLIAVILIGIIVTLLLTAFTVDQRQNAIRFRFGEVQQTYTKPGLYFKMPFLDSMRWYDTRIQTLDRKDAERIQTKEKNNVVVDSFVKYRIVDVKQFFISTQGDVARAEVRLSQTINDDLRAEFGQRTLAEVVSGERDKIMETMRKKADADARNIGIEVLDVRLKRVDLVPEISEDVYKRMDSERKRIAAELRATGSGEADKIRADAERQRTVILAEAYRDAQKVKGEGDAQAARTYAQAFSKNPEFYSFYRSMEAYRESFKNKSDVMVLEPNSDFFKYMRNPQRGAAQAPRK
jgi:modulator of FtsH protease HflC